MAVTLAEIFAGPADLWVAEFGAAEPEISETPAVAWRNVGATDGGVQLMVNQSMTPITVDQIAAELGALMENQSAAVVTTFAQATLENYKVALNGGTITAVAAQVGPPAIPAYHRYEPNNDLVNEPLTYHAILMRGKTLSGLRGQFIIRRSLSTANIESTFGKTTKAALGGINLSSYYVSDSIPAFAFDTEDAA